MKLLLFCKFRFIFLQEFYVRYLRGANWDVPTALGIVILTFLLSLTVLPLVPDSAAQNCTVSFTDCTLIDGAATSTRFCRLKLYTVQLTVDCTVYSQLYSGLGSSFTALSSTVLPLVPDSAAQ